MRLDHSLYAFVFGGGTRGGLYGKFHGLVDVSHLRLGGGVLVLLYLRVYLLGKTRTGKSSIADRQVCVHGKIIYR